MFRLHLRILMIIPMDGIILVIGVNQLKILQKWSKRKNKILGVNSKTGYLTRNQLRKRIETETLAISKSKTSKLPSRQIQAIYISSSKLISSNFIKYRWLVYPIIICRGFTIVIIGFSNFRTTKSFICAIPIS